MMKKGGDGVAEIDWKRLAAITVTLTGGVLAVYLLLRYALGLFLPFLLAFLLALCTRPLVRLITRRTGCPERVCACLVTLAALVVSVLLLVVLCNRLLLEVQNLLNFLVEDSADPEGELSRVMRFLRGFWERLPLLSHLQQIDFLRELIGDPQTYLIEHLRGALSNLASGLAATAGELLRRLPGVLLFLLITVISCFYVAMDYGDVVRALKRLLPQRLAARLPHWHRVLSETAKRCLKAYLLLFLLTLGELTLGFLLLRIRYPFLLALLCACLDILPVLGVGTVLLPWALLSFVAGHAARGVGLLILYGVMTVVRQIAEPHLVGKSLGLHPLPMLMAFYIGLRVFGAAGLLLGPALALLLKGLLGRDKPPQEPA